jgi:hypothetical protein
VKAVRSSSGALKTTLNTPSTVSAFTIYIKHEIVNNGSGGVYTLAFIGPSLVTDRFEMDQNQENNNNWTPVVYRTGQKYGKSVPIDTIGTTESIVVVFDLVATPQIRAWKNGTEQLTVVGATGLLTAIAQGQWFFGINSVFGNCANEIYKDIVVFNTAKTPAEVAALFALLG